MLSLVTFVYAVFTISTLVTALTSNAYNLPDNMTYTEYARSGFFQLAWLSVINFLLLLGAQFMMRNKSEKAKTAAKVIFTIQVVINLCLLGLSAYKMSLYSGAYGLTLLRTLVYIILAYELVMLLMLMFKVYNEKFKFVLVATYFSFAFWGVVSFINIEAFAVGYNTKNLTVDEFDFSYTCYRTSKDSSSALKDYVIDNYDKLDEYEIDQVKSYYDIGSEGYYTEAMYERDWFEYNISFSQHSKNRDEIIEFLNDQE